MGEQSNVIKSTDEKIDQLSIIGQKILFKMVQKCSSSKYLYRPFVEGCYDGIIHQNRDLSHEKLTDDKNVLIDLTIELLNKYKGNIC